MFQLNYCFSFNAIIIFLAFWVFHLALGVQHTIPQDKISISVKSSPPRRRGQAFRYENFRYE